MIDESYNANPASVRAALALLGATEPGPSGRRIAVLGEMRELGTEGAALHEALAPDLVAQRVDLLFAAARSPAACSTRPCPRRKACGPRARPLSRRRSATPSARATSS